jgi:thymidylate kinase
MTQPALLICFIGIDGSGKTTQARLLIDWLESRGVKSLYVWSRGPVLTIRKVLLFLGRKVLGTSAQQIASDKNTYREYQSRKSKLKGNSFIRQLWSAMTCVEHIVQINWDIRRKMQNGCVVVCDRYLWDSTIDLAVLNNKGPKWLSSGLNKILWKFIPRPTITFFIDISPEEALLRKNDIPSFDYVRKRAELYRYLAKSDSLTVINGCGDVVVIQNSIINTVKNYIEG